MVSWIVSLFEDFARVKDFDAEEFAWCVEFEDDFFLSLIVFVASSSLIGYLRWGGMLCLLLCHVRVSLM